MYTDPATLRHTDRLPATPSVLASTVPRLDHNWKVPNGVAHPPQRLFLVLDELGRLRGVATRAELIDGRGTKISDVMIRKPVVVHPGDTLRMVANLFAERHITSAPVVDSEHGGKVLGLITVDQLLDGRLRDLAEEYDRERPFSRRR